MRDAPSPTLDFKTLDGLAFAAERGRLSGRSLSIMAARELGPVLELALLAEGGLLPSPHAAPWLSLDGLAPLGQALKAGRGQWICPHSRLIGFLCTGLAAVKDDAIWTGFGVAAQRAAKKAGFPRRIAAQLAAALGELHSNIYEHALAPDTGVIAFRAQPGRFEFVVADRGIGVLESLRSAATYEKLDDHGEALRLALSEGVSRFGSDAGRGHGFRPLFVGLANLKGTLRFRSGDHALMIDGQHPTLMTARVAQKPSVSGLLISVNCETAAPPRGTNGRPSSISDRN